LNSKKWSKLENAKGEAAGTQLCAELWVLLVGVGW